MKSRQMIIELSQESAKQAEKLSREQKRTPEELISDLLRSKFSGGDVSVIFTSRKIRVVKATKAEEKAIQAGRAEIEAGQYTTFNDLKNELGNPSRKKSRKAAKKVS